LYLCDAYRGARERAMLSARRSPLTASAPSLHSNYGLTTPRGSIPSMTGMLPHGAVLHPSSSAFSLHSAASTPHLLTSNGHSSPPGPLPMMAAYHQPSPPMPQLHSARIQAAEMSPRVVQDRVVREADVRQLGARWSQNLEAEVARRHHAEARVRELEALVARLRSRITTLEGKKEPVKMPVQEEPPIDDAIDRAICEYLERNPDFPVAIQKVAQNYYVFGDRGTVYVTQRGNHIVVRVGGGFKSLQVFMDERALMVTGDNAVALSSSKA